jgi:GT2 family glycosyltransferase
MNKFSVIVPYYSNKKGLIATLINLQTQSGVHHPHASHPSLIVVDTSPQQDAQMIVNEFYLRHSVSHVIRGQMGIYEAWNEAIKTTDGDCLIINDDILMPTNFFHNLYKAREIFPNAYAFVPRTNGKKYGNGQIATNFSWQGEDLVSRNQCKETDWLVGFCFYLTKECITDIGLVDSNFKVWFGDDDYQRRVLAKSRIIEISPSLIHHYGGSSYQYQDPKVLAKIQIDRELFNRKYLL